MKYFSRLLSGLLILLAPSVWAYSIDEISYERSTQTIFVTLSYQGGLTSHEFSTLFDPCVKDKTPNELAVRLVDTGWKDTGKDNLKSVVPIDLSQADCSPAEVTVFISRRHATIFVD